MAVQPFKLILVLTNFSILAFVLVLIFDHLCANNNLKSWALLFHILCFLWLCFRGMFWLTTMTATASWGSADYFFLYWMPTPIEFGAFMVLPLYFAQVLYPDKWKSLWGWIQPIYAFLVAGMTAVQAIWIIMACILQVGILFFSSMVNRLWLCIIRFCPMCLFYSFLRRLLPRTAFLCTKQNHKIHLMFVVRLNISDQLLHVLWCLIIK